METLQNNAWKRKQIFIGIFWIIALILIHFGPLGMLAHFYLALIKIVKKVYVTKWRYLIIASRAYYKWSYSDIYYKDFKYVTLGAIFRQNLFIK